MHRRSVTHVMVSVLLALSVVLSSESQTSSPAGSMTTRERVASSVWWPTSTTSNVSGFAGSAACVTCHAEIVQTQRTSQMAHTLGTAGEATVLLQHRKQQYRSGAYTYTVREVKDHMAMTVSDGSESRSADLQWAFGSGEVGQSYLWPEKDGSFREARFNYFATMEGFGATPGRLHGVPTSIDMALGRRVEGFEAKTCFACHTTRLSSATTLDANSFVPGVTCEACHGPAVQHIAAMQTADSSGTPTEIHIVNPEHMTPAQSVDFCGACHSTPWDVRMMGATGLQTVRFPAYRLEKSRCWGARGDALVTCISCHDPHEPLERNAAAYDYACVNCHRKSQSVANVALDARHPGAACPVGTAKCVTCHMPKYDLPEMHSKFTDHMIRVVRPSATLPD